MALADPVGVMGVATFEFKKMAEKIGMKHGKTEARGYITYICLIFMFYTLLYITLTNMKFLKFSSHSPIPPI